MLDRNVLSNVVWMYGCNPYAGRKTLDIDNHCGVWEAVQGAIKIDSRI